MNKQPILDIHAHIFPDKIAAKAVKAIGDFYDIPMQAEGVLNDLLACGEKAGVTHYLIHSVATRPAQAHSINDFIAACAAAEPRVTGFGSVHPYMEGLLEEVDRMEALGLKGVKIHPDFQEFDIDDPKAMALYRHIEGRLPILIHMGDKTKTFSRPLRLHKVLQKFPNLTAIAAHFGGYNAWEESREYLVGSPAYFDTSSTLFALPVKEADEIIRAHGVEKMLFGSDYPMWTHADEMQRFNQLTLNETERRKILFENGRALLGLPDEL